jgi:hypothetical protein
MLETAFVLPATTSVTNAELRRTLTVLTDTGNALVHRDLLRSRRRKCPTYIMILFSKRQV